MTALAVLYGVFVVLFTFLVCFYITHPPKSIYSPKIYGSLGFLTLIFVIAAYSWWVFWPVSVLVATSLFFTLVINLVIWVTCRKETDNDSYFEVDYVRMYRKYLTIILAVAGTLLLVIGYFSPGVGSYIDWSPFSPVP